MTRISTKDREVKVDREITVSKALKLYKDRYDEFKKWSIEVKVRQKVKIDNEIADDTVYSNEKYDFQLGETTVENTQKVVDQMIGELMEEANAQYEKISKLVSIAKDLQLDIVVEYC